MSGSKANSLVLSFLFGLGAATAQEGRPGYQASESVLALAGRVDVSCILRTWRLKGVLACHHRGHMVHCWWVENA